MLRHLSAHMSIARATEARNAQDTYHHEHGMTPFSFQEVHTPITLFTSREYISYDLSIHMVVRMHASHARPKASLLFGGL